MDDVRSLPQTMLTSRGAGWWWSKIDLTSFGGWPPSFQLGFFLSQKLMTWQVAPDFSTWLLLVILTFENLLLLNLSMSIA